MSDKLWKLCVYARLCALKGMSCPKRSIVFILKVVQYMQMYMYMCM